MVVVVPTLDVFVFEFSFQLIRQQSLSKINIEREKNSLNDRSKELDEKELELTKKEENLNRLVSDLELEQQNILEQKSKAKEVKLLMF